MYEWPKELNKANDSKQVPQKETYIKDMVRTSAMDLPSPTSNEHMIRVDTDCR